MQDMQEVPDTVRAVSTSALSTKLRRQAPPRDRPDPASAQPHIRSPFVDEASGVLPCCRLASCNSCSAQTLKLPCSVEMHVRLPAIQGGLHLSYLQLWYSSYCHALLGQQARHHSRICQAITST